MIKNKEGEYNLWQRHYWEHQIRDELDLQWHVDYIHFNPVKHGHVKRVVDWPRSSFHRYVRSGILDEDWGGGFMLDADGGYGERTSDYAALHPGYLAYAGHCRAG